MAASATDQFIKTGEGTATTLASPGYTIGNTSVTVVSTTNWPTDTAVIFAIDTAKVENGEQVQEDGSYCEFVGVVTGATTISSVALVTGTPQNYTAGTLTRVYIPLSSETQNRMVDGILEEHNQDGTHQDGFLVTDYIADDAVTNAKLADDAVDTDQIADDAVTADKIDVSTFSYVLARRNATSTIPTSSGTAVVFQNEVADTNGEYNASTGVFTAASDMNVVVTTGVRFQEAAGAITYVGIQKALAASPTSFTSVVETNIPSPAGYFPLTASTGISLAAGDKLRVIVYQNQGGNRTLDSNGTTGYITITRSV